MSRAQRSPGVVGFLGSESLPLWAKRVKAFQEGLTETGHVENRNVTVEYRWAEGYYDRLPMLAADLVRRRVSVIAAPLTQSALAAKAATRTTPIVFITGGDPVNLGLVDTLERPGGNLTGITNLNVGLAPRRLEILHELLPNVVRVALLVDPTNPNADSIVAEVRTAVTSLGLQLVVLHATSERDFDAVFNDLTRLRAEALLIGTEGFLVTRSVQVASLTLLHRVPTLFQFREYVAAGGLISYGGSSEGNFHQMGVHVGRILNGERPATIAVEPSKRFELIINLKTAKTLGITVPEALLRRANEIIE
jgi:putative tryptophan/tyrosine transport system substrate-binding protein